MHELLHMCLHKSLTMGPKHCPTEKMLHNGFLTGKEYKNSYLLGVGFRDHLGAIHLSNRGLARGQSS